MNNCEIILTSGQRLTYSPTIKEKVIFIEWLKKKNAYDSFIKMADLPFLSNEKDPKQFLVSLNWDKIENNVDEEDYWNSILDSWLVFISQRDFSLIESGIESKDKYKQELFNRKVIEKLEKMDFNKLSNEQYKKLDEILK